MNGLTCAAAAAVLLASATPALAQDGPRQMSVSYSDLDLTRTEGVDRLKQRVRAAVQAVCRADDQTLKQQLRQKSCARQSAASSSEAVARAVGRANQAQASARPPRAITVTR